MSRPRRSLTERFRLLRIQAGDRLRSLVAVLPFLALLGLTIWRLAREGDQERAGYDAPTGVVARVIDGDTLLLASGRRVRLLGVDTPETKHPSKPPEPWGEQASAFSRRLVEGRRVGLEYDRHREDRYGRTLAWVRIDDSSLLNVELVRAGLSPAVLLSPLRPDYRRALLDAQDEAVAAERGLHSEHAPGEPPHRAEGNR